MADRAPKVRLGLVGCGKSANVDHLPALRHRVLLLLADQAYPDVRSVDLQRELRGAVLAVLNEFMEAELGPTRLFEAVYFTNFVIE